MLSNCLLVFAATCGVAMCLTEPILDFPQVQIPNGMQIVGQTTQHAHSFHSIPYGQAPVDNLRYMPPVPFNSTDLFNASIPNYVACVQLPSVYTSELEFSEDCLVLSIYVPSAVNLHIDDDDLLPVLFWIHGGAYYAGSGNEKRYESRYLSNHTNTIVVTINYRLDALGFLAYTSENGVSFEGNQGHKDQQLALKWVNDNIRTFGGDPNKVTIAGQSAGAQSVSFHLLSPISEPYFRRAIGQSTFGNVEYMTTKESEVITQRLVEVLDCQGLSAVDCLRTKTAEEIVAKFPEVAALSAERGDISSSFEPYRPTVDGTDLTGQPLKLFNDGRWNTNKDVILGTTMNEMSVTAFSFNVSDDATFTDASIEYLGPKFGPIIAKEYLRKFEDDDPANYKYLLMDEFTDIFFLCPSIIESRFIANTSTNTDLPVFYYLYSYPETSADYCYDPDSPITNEACGLASHGNELAYLFEAFQGYHTKADDAIVTNELQDYWGSFVHNGQPTSSLFTTWPQYKPDISGGKWPSLRINSPNSDVIMDYRTDYCEFLESIGLFPIDTVSRAPQHYTSILNGIVYLIANLTMNLLF